MNKEYNKDKMLMASATRDKRVGGGAGAGECFGHHQQEYKGKLPRDKNITARALAKQCESKTLRVMLNVHNCPTCSFFNSNCLGKGLH